MPEQTRGPNEDTQPPEPTDPTELLPSPEGPGDAPVDPNDPNDPNDPSEPEEPEALDVPGDPAEAKPAAVGEPEAPPRPARRSRRGRVAAVIGVIGELMITGGVVIALFVIYSLWWTNIVANQEAQRDSQAVREGWESGPDDGDDTTPPLAYDPKDGIGFLHVPSMYGGAILVKEGISLDTLNGGVAGTYDTPLESAMPWDEEGNVSLAAHRDGHGAKFHNIHHIEEGDSIVFETRNNWYIYRVYSVLPETSKYNTDVLAPIPKESGRKQPGNYITLTTCTPILSSSHRYIVWGELERTDPVSKQRTPPPELREDS